MSKEERKDSFPPRFAVDVMLGKLAKWLRILGFDTSYSTAWETPGLIATARTEGRTILSRNTLLVKRIPASIPYLFIKNDSFWHQLQEVVSHFRLAPDPSRFFTRCSLCNSPLIPLPVELAAGRVPEYVLRTQAHFSQCPACQRIYWSGTHRKRAEDMVREMLSRVGETDFAY